MTWADASSNESGFVLQFATNPDFSDARNFPAAAGATDQIVDSLKGGTLYYARVAAYTAAGGSAYSSVTSLITAPTGLKSTNSTTSGIDLSWDHGGQDVRMIVERRVAVIGGPKYAYNYGYYGGYYGNPDQNYKVDEFKPIATLSAGASTFHDTTGITEGTRYEYRIRAKHDDSVSKPSESIFEATIPLAPTNPTVTLLDKYFYYYGGNKLQ